VAEEQEVKQEETQNFEMEMDVNQIVQQANETVKEEALNIAKEKDPELENKIKELKEEYGEVYLYIFDPEQFYIYRPVNRGEYVRIMSQAEDEDDTQLLLVNSCVLYPEVQFDNSTKAGTIDVLVNLIMYASNFASNNPVVKL
jgi:hypothetical protein